LGNVKSYPGDGFDYICLNGVWEGCDPVKAAELIAAGRAVRDPSPDHAAAVGPGKVSVIFPPPQPESRFRAYPDLATGMAGHLRFLAKGRYVAAWPFVLAGDPAGFAHALHDRGYYTASAVSYAAGMMRAFMQFMGTSAYELALDGVNETRDAETVPELPTAADEPTVIAHVDPSLYSLDVDPDEITKS
jgi:hypothetical protein